MGFLNALPAVFSGIDAITGIGANKDRKKEANANRQLQLDTLHNQIQWRVADAKKAGIHPMAALGFTGMGYTPTSTNFEGTDFSAVGQDISRAIASGQTEAQRRLEAGRATVAASQEAEYNAARIRNLDMETELLRSQIARANSAQLGPSIPGPGSVELQPDRVTVGSPGAPERSPGIVTDYSFGRTARGFSLNPGQDIKQRIEDMPSEWGWFLRNGLIPDARIVGDLTRMYPPEPGYRWRFSPITQEFTQVAIDPMRTPSSIPYRR